MIRTKFLVPLLLFIASLGVLAFFAGALMERIIEGPISNQYGAKIEVDSIDVSYFPLSVHVKGVDVTDLNDAMKNAVSIETIRFSMAFLPLIEKKALIPDLTVEDLQFNTVRTKSGAIQRQTEALDASKKKEPGLASKASKKVMSSKLAKKTKQKVNEKASQLKEDAFSFQSPEMENPVQLKTRQEAAALEQEIKDLQDKWEARFKENPAKSEYMALKTDWAQFKAQYPSNIDSIETITQQITKVKSLQDQSKAVVETISAEKKGFDQDYQHVNNKINRLSQLAEQDYQNAVNQLNTDTYSFDNITEMYLTAVVEQKIDPVMTRVRQGLSTYKRFRGSAPPKVNSTWRHPGQLIYFPKERSLPTLWIQRIVLSASTNAKQSLRGEIFNVTSYQAAVGEATMGSIKGENLTGAGHLLDLEFTYDDGSRSTAGFKFNGAVSGISVPRTTVVQKGSETIYLDSANLVISTQGSYQKDLLDVRAVIDARRLRFKQRGISMDAFTLNRLIFMSLVSMPRLKVNAQVTGTMDDWDLSMSSNLDKFDVGGLMTDQLAQKKKKLREQLDADVQKQKEALNNIFTQQKDQLNQKVTGYQDQATQLENQLDERVQAESAKIKAKQDALKKEAQDKIDAEKAKLEAEKARVKKEAEDRAKKEAQKALKSLGF